MIQEKIDLLSDRFSGAYLIFSENIIEEFLPEKSLLTKNKLKHYLPKTYDFITIT